jgi:hypothetical protein
MEEDGDHAHLNMAILKMIVGGNHGLQFYPDGTLRGITFERFVTERDPSGKLLRWASRTRWRGWPCPRTSRDICPSTATRWTPPPPPAGDHGLHPRPAL